MVSLGKSRLNTVITFFYPSKISYSFILISSGSDFLSLVEAGQSDGQTARTYNLFVT